MRLTRRHAIGLTAGLVLTGVAPARSADGEKVGSVGDILNVGWGTIPGAARTEIEFEDLVYMNELVETEAESALVVNFADGSKLTLGENAKLLIDKYVYNPASNAGEAVITATEGAFRFISGAMPEENVSIQTPTVTIGIRGTEIYFDVAADGGTELSTVSGEADCIDGAGQRLTVRANESILTGADRRFRGAVRRFRHATRSIAVAEGLNGARRRWRIRKQRRRAIRQRLRGD